MSKNKIVKDFSNEVIDDLKSIRKTSGSYSKLLTQPVSDKLKDLMETLQNLSSDEYLLLEIDSLIDKKVSQSNKEYDSIFHRQLVEDNFRSRTRTRGVASTLWVRRNQDLEDIYALYAQQHLKAVEANESYKADKIFRVMDQIRTSINATDTELKNLFEFGIDLESEKIEQGKCDNFKTGE